MKINTADLIGPALDWAVATCDGYECQFEDEDTGPWLVPQEGFLHDEKSLSRYSPSTNWSQGGPLIEREGINVVRCNDRYFPSGNEYGDYYEQYWRAEIKGYGDLIIPLYKEYGPTLLIAAMRCLVASRLGDEIDIPEELL